MLIFLGHRCKILTNIFNFCYKHKNYKDKWWKDKSKFKFKHKTKELRQKHKVCKTRIQKKIYYNEIKKCKQKKKT